jgi:hypothetical protein
MSVAFTREESAEAAAELELPDRPISPHPNLPGNALAQSCYRVDVTFSTCVGNV